MVGIKLSGNEVFLVLIKGVIIRQTLWWEKNPVVDLLRKDL